MNLPYVEATKVLDDAHALMTGQRATTYGDPLPDFTRIGQLWGALLPTDWQPNEPLPAHTVAAMLAGLKLVRSQITPEHRDNWVDLVAYGALAADVQARDTDSIADIVDDIIPPTHTAKMRTSARVRP